MAKRKKSLKKKKKRQEELGLKKESKKKTVLHTETKRGIAAVVCFSLAALSLLSFFNGAGIFGQYFFKISRFLFGFGFFLVSVGFILAGLAIIRSRSKISDQNKEEETTRQPTYQTIFLGMALFILSILGLFHIFGPERGLAVGQEAVKAGGYLGLMIGYPLAKYLSFWGALIVLTALMIISILITFNVPLKFFFRKKETFLSLEEKADFSSEKGVGPLGQFKEKLKERFNQEKEKKSEEGDYLLGRSSADKTESPIKQEEKEISSDSAKEESKILSSPAKTGPSKFKMPSLDFLEKDRGQPTSGDIKANINVIKRTLENFGIEVEMAEVNVGPSVTQYTLRPAQGIKLARITALQNDLSLALAAHPLRIEAPIPGRSLVGIEIPNRSVVLVRLRDLVERKTFQDSSSFLTFALGRDVAGNPMFADLDKMPHLLVAGATGTGKTIALNNLIISLLYRNSPEVMKLILIDPKRVELSAYNSIPHLLSPVVVQADKAIGALRWTVGEMERRFGVLQEAGKRDIATYNSSWDASVDWRKTKSEEGEEIERARLPYIVVMIDELADLMASHGREVEGAIVRLAQMARAVGIHLVVSTQRPSVEVITGLIKANITSRMAFQVASQVDSRTVLDMAGAEKLLGNGDMLFLAGNSAKPRRIQGAYISEKEVKKVVDHLKSVGRPDYHEEIAAGQSLSAGGSGFEGGGAEVDDELTGEAKKVVVQAGKASASLLQRRLRIGYARAARLLDILEEEGVVGPADGAKPRDVYIDEGEGEEF